MPHLGLDRVTLTEEATRNVGLWPWTVTVGLDANGHATSLLIEGDLTGQYRKLNRASWASLIRAAQAENWQIPEAEKFT